MLVIIEMNYDKIQVVMSTYVISDPHGCKKEFDAMLEKIQFSDEYDELWIVGDICDRGKESIALLQEIIEHKNMHIIYGNHDVWFERYMQELINCKDDSNQTDITEDFMTWLHYNGGYTTADQFMDLKTSECYDIKLYMEENKRFYQYLDVHNKKFLLVHAGLADEFLNPNVRMSEVPSEVLVWSHIDIDDNPFDDVTMIVGHVPTFCYGSEYEGKIIHGKNIYHIDCGCVFGRTLGCLRLDDMQEFYVESSAPFVSC